MKTYSENQLPIYQKMFARDFSLALLQIWYFGEYSDPRQWTEKKQPYGPYLFFIRTGPTVEVWVDQRGVDWVKAEIALQVGNNFSTVRSIADTYQAKIAIIQGLLDTLPVLSLIELKKFVAQVRDAWVWFEAFWWLVELAETAPNMAGELPYLLEVRKRTEKLAPAADAIIRKSFIAAYPKLSDYAGVVTLEEVFSGNFPAVDVLNKRITHYIYTDDTLFERETISDIEKKFSIKVENQKEESFSASKIIKGKVAYPGKVQGIVRKVYGTAQLAEFKKDEILVAASTTPDLITALHLAAAIVSDEGGIVCHAAIVARELKKPCIIGTKIAMDVLKDGDTVEVDATLGIVKLL